MKIFRFYYHSIINELIKLKNSYLLTIMVLSSVFIPAIYFVHYIVDHKRLLPDINGSHWDKFFLGQLTMTPTLITFFVVLIATFTVQIEHRSEEFKQLFSLPIPKSMVYNGKLFISAVVVFLTYLFFLVFLLLSGYAISLIFPEYGFRSYSPNLIFMIKILFSSYLTTLGILAIQYFISYKTKNFIVPIGIGIVMIILGLILFRSPRFAPFIPYAYNISNFVNLDLKNPSLIGWFTNYSVYSIIVFIGVSIFGSRNITKSNII